MEPLRPEPGSGLATNGKSWDSPPLPSQKTDKTHDASVPPARLRKQVAVV